MAERGLLIVLSGPSGVGKDTILNHFLAHRTDCVLSVSATTRPPRQDETEGVDYYFLTREKFGELAATGQMLEYAEYNGNYYGTPGAAVERLLREGKNVVLEIEVQGALQVREKCPDSISIFVAPPGWETLEARLRGRGTESEESLAGRLAAAKEELAHAEEYDYILINHTVEESCEKLGAIITAAGCLSKNMKEFLQEVCKNA